MKKILIISVVVISVLLNFLIFQKEVILTDGKTVLLKLAPVDPRSLMQGDYMVLRYDIAQEIYNFYEERDNDSIDGKIVLKLDSEYRAVFKQIYSVGYQLQDNEWLLKFKMREGFVHLAARSYFFQEGHGEFYEEAKFGELKVSVEGNPVLVGLRDSELKPIVPEIER